MGVGVRSQLGVVDWKDKIGRTGSKFLLRTAIPQPNP